MTERSPRTDLGILQGSESLFQAAESMQEPCGRFGCTLPKGHNTGRADVPSNHSRRLREDAKVKLLALHAISEIRCDHDLRRDLPICNCGTVNLGWWPTVQAAKEAWARHVIDEMERVPTEKEEHDEKNVRDSLLQDVRPATSARDQASQSSETPPQVAGSDGCRTCHRAWTECEC